MDKDARKEWHRLVPILLRMRVLTEAGLIRARDHGRERHYELVRGALAPVAHLLAELTSGRLAQVLKERGA